MGTKRKRSRQVKEKHVSDKRQRIAGQVSSNDIAVRQALLAQYYQHTLTLREYLLTKLPVASKVRRKKIRTVGKKSTEEGGINEESFAQFLDQTLVGVLRGDENRVKQDRWQQWTTFAQRADESVSTLANLDGPPQFSQSEIVDFSIWLLFSKGSSNGRNSHLLCQGFRKEITARSMAHGSGHSPIPGVVSTYPNSHVTSMKAYPWPKVLALLGKEGERAMIDLIIDCGIFLPVPSTQGIFHQLSGFPLGDLNVISPWAPVQSKVTARKDFKTGLNTTLRSSADITFVRNHMLYARAALNAHGGVRFGFRHIHVLNRYTLGPLPAELNFEHFNQQHVGHSTLQLLMYLFPRQFGLHNVFTSNVDTRQIVQPFQDYTLREDEIKKKYPGSTPPKIPKRLRSNATKLVRKLQVQHSRCSYSKLLDHYCPVTRLGMMNSITESPSSTGSSLFKTQYTPTTVDESTLSGTQSQAIPARKSSMMDHSTPSTMVSGFGRAVISRLVPYNFWGSGDTQKHNIQVLNRNIDRFIELRRFESLSLHEVSQGMKIGKIEWLGPPESPQNKLSQSDFKKRWEIFHEFLYYIFDSILIPLIRANFHVTESNIHRYKLFYFRHDVWRTLAEPALASLKISMFEEIKLDRAHRILNSRSLGFSQVRLLPKETGIRPIMNLRRRALKKGTSPYLGSSINSVLAPVYNALTYEKNTNPSLLGSTLFSVGDVYSRLKVFKASLGSNTQPLYFAKVDVKSAFDTIPQSAVLQLMSTLPTETSYRIAKHLEMKPGEDYRSDNRAKAVRKYVSLAHSPDDVDSFDEKLESGLASGRKNTIFVENILNQFRDTDELLKLLCEHVSTNMVKIGKKFYRQKEGIPQGSVVSSLLCNYFYADLEAKHLGFLKSGDTLLLRLIDDFLLITTNRSHAKQFLQVMHDGLPAYGVGVNPDKTLVNFEAQLNGKKVPRLVGTNEFPYCGSFINTQRLDITRDRERRKGMAVSDSLTVEFSKMPGKTFHRKVLNTFKIQSHAMFLDTAYNSLSTVLSNIYTAFRETATKMWTYAKCLPKGKQPGTKLLIKTIEDLIELAFALMKSKGRNKKNQGYNCAVSKVQVEWLAINAFQRVLEKKQSKYTRVLEWLDIRKELLHLRERDVVSRLKSILDRETAKRDDDCCVLV